MTGRKTLVVHAAWDDEAKVWVVTSEDIPGLVTEAASLDILAPKLRKMIPEMLDANGYSDGEEIPYKVVSEFSDVAHRETA